MGLPSIKTRLLRGARVASKIARTSGSFIDVAMFCRTFLLTVNSEAQYTYISVTSSSMRAFCNSRSLLTNGRRATLILACPNKKPDRMRKSVTNGKEHAETSRSIQNFIYFDVDEHSVIDLRSV